MVSFLCRPRLLVLPLVHAINTFSRSLYSKRDFKGSVFETDAYSIPVMSILESWARILEFHHRPLPSNFLSCHEVVEAYY